MEAFEDGVWWVELASLSHPNLVPQAVAQALNMPEAPGHSLTEILVEHLQPRKALLVLDNCEHLVEACAALADALLRACPKLRVLATSREALCISGERAWLVPSLSLPGPRRPPDPEGLARYETVRLFVEQAEVHRVSEGEILSEIDREARRRLGISGEGFAEACRKGLLPDALAVNELGILLDSVQGASL